MWSTAASHVLHQASHCISRKSSAATAMTSRTRVLLAVLVLLGGIDRNATLHTTRVRKSWTAYRHEEKELYLEAVKQAMACGYHFMFTQLYMDKESLHEVVGTCGAPAWYRKYLLGYETMLRALNATYANVTLPFWDMFEDSAKRLSSSTSCLGLEGCSSLLHDFGGCQGPELVPRSFVVNGEAIPSGNCANSSIAAHACATTGTACEKCLPRGDWGIGDATLEFGPTTFADLIRHASDARNTRSNGMDTLREEVQNSVQLIVHSVLGGVYETRAAAFDPVFFSHYATLDMVYHFFQSCNQTIALTGSCKSNGNRTISPTATIPMKIENTPVEKHAKLGAFFKTLGTTFESMDTVAVEYEIGPFLENMLQKFSLQCNAEKSAVGAISYATGKYMFEDAAAVTTLVDDLVACDQTSKMNGTTIETPSALISCQLLSSLQNGVFTNFSTPVREFFGVTQDDLPKCVGALAAVTAVEVTVMPSVTCHKMILKDTSINTKTDFKSVSDGFAIVTRGAEDGEMRYMQPAN